MHNQLHCDKLAATTTGGIKVPHSSGSPRLHNDQLDLSNCYYIYLVNHANVSMTIAIYHTAGMRNFNWRVGASCSYSLYAFFHALGDMVFCVLCAATKPTECSRVPNAKGKGNQVCYNYFHKSLPWYRIVYVHYFVCN